MLDRFSKKIRLSSSTVRRLVFFVWLIPGSLVPFTVMFFHIGEISRIWKSHPDLILVLAFAAMSGLVVIAILFSASEKLEAAKTRLCEHEIELELVVAERTQELQDMISQLEVVASTDALTKLANRRLIRDTLREEFARFLRSKRSFSIIMFDIDHFKNINDTYGHPMGDKVLVEIADTVKSMVRDVDLFGRYGGEEFLIILPETSMKSALEIAERIRIRIELMKIENISITASLGVVSSDHYTSVSDMIDGVDDALYMAKEGGRNTVRTPDDKTPGNECGACDDGDVCSLMGSNFDPKTCRYRPGSKLT